MINLDYASHTPADPRVLAEFCRVAQSFTGNPMSSHQNGQAASGEESRITFEIADLLGISPEELIYTSGASEANNLAIKGLTKAYKHVGKHVLSTCLEHPSVSGTLAYLQENGYEIELLKLRPNGKIDIEALRAALRADTVLVSIAAVDSELGVIQPIQEVVRVLEMNPGCHLHVDAAQAVGKLPLDLNGVSTLSISPHKFHGICGVGLLYKREGVVIEPLIHGGASTTIYRSGTPALALMASACKALELALNSRAESLKKAAEFQKYIRASLSGYPLVRINSPEGNSPYILNISVKGVKAPEFQASLDSYGVMVSVKSACSTDRSPSRAVMAVTPEPSEKKNNGLSSWRISFSRFTQFEELDKFLEIFNICYRELTEPLTGV